MKVTEWNGKPIKVPGWYSGVPIEKYHGEGLCSGPSVSSTDLRTCWKYSPKHMYYRWAENPKREEREATREMILGAVTHHLILGEDGFNTKYVASPEQYRDLKTAEWKEWTYRANFCKDWRAKHEAVGRIVVPPKDFRAIVEMAKSLALETLAKDGLLNGHVETTGVFLDKETGLWVKVRPDVVPPTDDIFIDLKTAREVTTYALQYGMREHGYHQQGALIWQACEELGHPFTSFMLLSIETSSPWCARTDPINKDDLSLARQMNRSSLQRIADAIERDHWAGPSEGELNDLCLALDERARIQARLKREGLL